MKSPRLKETDGIYNMELRRLWVVQMVFQNGVHDPWQYRLHEVKMADGPRIHKPDMVKSVYEIDSAIEERKLLALTDGAFSVQNIFKMTELLFG